MSIEVVNSIEMTDRNIESILGRIIIGIITNIIGIETVGNVKEIIDIVIHVIIALIIDHLFLFTIIICFIFFLSFFHFVG